MDELDALYDAAIAGDAVAISELEQRATRLYEKGYTILHTESKNGNTERVRFILKEFADKNLLTKLTKYKHSALHWAVYRGHTQVAEMIIEAAREQLPETSFQAFLRQGDKDNDTALHAAVTYGHVEIVKLLVEADPTDAHIQNDEGKTPMYIAVEKGLNDIVERISTTCTAPSLDGPDGSAALRINSVDQAKSPGRTLYKIMDRDALYAAAIAGDADAIANLEKKADLLNEYEETILHIESQNGNIERVRFILREFANKNLLAKLSKYKHTALHLAIYRGRTEVAKVIIEAARRHLPETSFQDFLRQGDKDNDTALHAAVMEGNKAIVKLLVEADPTDPHTQNDEGKTPMYIAVEEGSTEIVELISTICTAPSLDGPDGGTVMLINNLNLDQETRVKSSGGILYQIMDRDASYAAAFAGDTVARARLEMKADKVNKNKETILHVESRNGNIEHVRFILREFANKNLVVKLNINDETALHLAIYSGHTEVAKVIIEAARQQLPVTSFQEFLRQRDEDNETALHLAVKNGSVAIVKLLVEADPTDQHTQNDMDRTPMYIAVEKGFNEIVELISTICTAPSLDGPDGSIVVRINNLDQVKSPGGTLYKIMDRLEALCYAAIAGDADAIAKLEMEADILHEYGETILHIESESGNTEHVRFILREFVNKNFLGKLNKFRQTALHLAVDGGHIEVAEVLIEAARQQFPETSFEAFLRQGDDDNDTALCYAVVQENIAIVKLLVEADPTDTHTQNNEGKSPMYIAVEKGFKDIVEIISIICTAPSLDGPDGSTALHAAVKNRSHSIEVVKVFIDAARRLLSSDSDSHDTESNPVTSFQAFLRRVDKDKNTALHIAVMQGNLATAKLLVETDPSYLGIQNNKGETPFYIAAERGYADVLKMMCTTSTAASLNLYGRLSAWHSVIKNLDEGKNEVRDVIKLFIDVWKCALISDTGDLDEYKIYRVFAAEIFSQIDEHRQTILELVVERNYVEVVELLLGIQNPAYKDEWIGDDFISLMPLIYIAKDKEYMNMVKVLTERYDAGAHLSADLKNQVSLISAIRRRKAETVNSLLDEHAHSLVTFVDNLGWTALHHAVYHEFNSIIKPIVEAQKEFEPQFVYRDKLSTPFHVAVERGYASTVILLMQLWLSSSSAYISVDKNGQNILHLAALQSKKQMIQDILKYCSEKHRKELVNKQDNDGNTPLHLLIKGGCLVPELLRYKELDTSVKNKEDWIPSDMLYMEEEMTNDQVKIKVALDHIQLDQKRDIFSSSVLSVTKREKKDENFKKRAEILIDEKLTRMKEDTRAVAKCFADAIAGDPICRAALEMEADTLNEAGETILHAESKKGVIENVGYIVREFGNKKLLVKLDNQKQTALHLAAHHKHTQVVEALLDAARLNLPSSSANDDTHNPVTPFQAYIRQANVPDQNTALHVAVLSGDVAIVKLLVKADPNDSHVKNNKGKTPIYIAVENGFKDVVKEICTTCTALSLDGPADSTTALHALIQNLKQGKEEDRDLIMMTINAAKRWSLEEDALHANFEALFDKADDSGRTPLELAMFHNHVNAVELILREDPAYQDGHASKNHGLLCLINRAMDSECSKDIVRLLSQTFEAGNNPDLKSVLALIIAIQRRETDSISKLLEEDNILSFVDSKGWTLLHHAAYHEFDSVLGIIVEAQEKVGHQFVYEDGVATPFHVAAKCGYTSTVIRLMQVFRASPYQYTTVDENDQNILHLAAVQNKKEMANSILRYCPTTHKDQLLRQKDIEGNTPLHLLVSHGCYIKDLVNYIVCDKTQNNEYWTPRDMLYFQHDIVREQVQIKMALDDIDTDQSRTFWSGSTKKKNTFSSLVLPSRKEQKDIIFYDAEKLLRDAKNAKMKEDLQSYKEGTNSQIVVSALITTITFTVGFTMPGGLYQSGEIDEGLAVLSKKAAFKVFMISDALALLLSICSLFIYFLENMSQDLDQVTRLHATTVGLNIASVMLTMFVFMTGTYVVLSESLSLSITICVIGSLFFIFVIVQLLRVAYERRVRKNEDYKKEA